MRFFADFHIHSHYSLATSRELTPEKLDYWAGIKGIKVVGSGDFTHPGWIKELKEKLAPAEAGLYKLKNEYKINGDSNTRFTLTAEISSVYKKLGKVRRIHNILFAPDFAVVEKISSKLQNIGKLTSDGRPILKLDSRDLLEICLDVSDKTLLVPAHIWTPWYSVLGAKSGFDSIEMCFEDLSNHIFAVETGLSSDPPMNRRCEFLDNYTLISNSDAHSPEKLGREANIFNCELNYEAIISAIKKGSSPEFLGTIEFYPQEGKYYYDGHRKCGISLSPEETKNNNNLCPVCGKKVTLGVLSRIQQLSNRPASYQHPKQLPFHSLIPLKNILSAYLHRGVNTKKVTTLYHDIINKTGSELEILLNFSVNDLNTLLGEELADAVYRARSGNINITKGYDGKFGEIVFF